MSTLKDPIVTPSTNPFLIATHINPASPSATMRNKKGVGGSPCLRPLFVLNSNVELPLTKTDKVADSRQALI